MSLSLSPDVFDLSQPIVATANGPVVSDRRFDPSVAALVAWAARDYDRTMLVGAELQLALK
jgi:F420-0:gamma-glutamyl ligase-like protein